MTDRDYSVAGTILTDVYAAQEKVLTAFQHAHAANEATSQKDEAVREMVAQLSAAVTALGNAARRGEQAEDAATDRELDRRLADAKAG